MLLRFWLLLSAVVRAHVTPHCCCACHQPPHLTAVGSHAVTACWVMWSLVHSVTVEAALLCIYLLHHSTNSQIDPPPFPQHTPCLCMRCQRIVLHLPCAGIVPRSASCQGQIPGCANTKDSCAARCAESAHAAARGAKETSQGDVHQRGPRGGGLG